MTVDELEREVARLRAQVEAAERAVEALVLFAQPFADALDVEADFMTPPAPLDDGFEVRKLARAALAAWDASREGG